MILKDDKVLFPDVLYPMAGNFFLAIFTGERFLRKDHGELREVAKSAKLFQRSSDPTGSAILFAPWLRHFGHGFSFYEFIKGSMGVANFIKVSN